MFEEKIKASIIEHLTKSKAQFRKANIRHARTIALGLLKLIADNKDSKELEVTAFCGVADRIGLKSDVIHVKLINGDINIRISREPGSDYDAYKLSSSCDRNVHAVYILRGEK